MVDEDNDGRFPDNSLGEVRFPRNRPCCAGRLPAQGNRHRGTAVHGLRKRTCTSLETPGASPDGATLIRRQLSSWSGPGAAGDDGGPCCRALSPPGCAASGFGRSRRSWPQWCSFSVVAVRGVPWWGVVSSAAAPVLLFAGWTVAAALQPGSFDAAAGTVSALAAVALPTGG